MAEPGGYGRLRVGADLKAMKAAGIAAKSLAPCTGFSLPPAFAAHGVAVTENHGLVTNVWYSGPNPDNAKVTLVSTAEGIHVGSSLSELRAAYGRDLVDAPIDMEGGPMRTNVLFRPDGALVFLIDEHEKVAAMVSTTGSNLDDLVVATGGGC